MAKKKRQEENKENVDHSQEGASHLTSDKAESFKEVSFNVLENAVERRNSLFGYKSHDFRNRAIISSDEMLPSSKGTRSIGKLSVFVLVIILFLGLLAGLVIYLHNNGYFEEVDHSDPLKEAIVEIESYDYPIMKLNAFLQLSANSTRIRQTNIDKDELKESKEGLSELDKKISDIQKGLNPQSEDYLMAGYAKQTIEARLMMIDSGLRIYDKLISSVEIINETENMWQNVLKADAMLKESDNLVQSNSMDNYALAKQNSEQAVQLLAEASSLINNLQNKTPDFDFHVYAKYITARYDSAAVSVQACQALLDQNLDTISSLNLSYIEKSNIASDIAMTMSTTPVQVLRTDYDLKTRPLIEEFKAARKNAADNDFALRNFLISE